MSYQITVTGHAGTAEDEKNIMDAARQLVDVAAQSGTVDKAEAYTSYMGSVNFLAEVAEDTPAGTNG